MRLGLQLPSFSFPGGTSALRGHLVEIAQAADAAGLESLWVMDHLFQLPEDTGWGGPDEPMLEAYATLGFLAGVTSRIRLGALVGCAMFRSPGLLVKTATRPAERSTIMWWCMLVFGTPNISASSMRLFSPSARARRMRSRFSSASAFERRTRRSGGASVSAVTLSSATG